MKMKLIFFNFLLAVSVHGIYIKNLILFCPLQTFSCYKTFYSASNPITWLLTMTGGKKCPFSCQIKIVHMVTNIYKIFLFLYCAAQLSVKYSIFFNVFQFHFHILDNMLLYLINKCNIMCSII